MPVPANIENYTVPGGVKLFFDNGTGERDLGNLVSLDLETGTEELEHYTNRSGKRMKDKVIVLEEKLALKFKFDEPVIENLKYFLKGGDIENVGAGTASKTDQVLALPGTVLQSVGQYYGLSAVTVRQFLDKVLHYDGSAYTDQTAEADSLAGTPFTVLTDADDALYLGKNTPFQELYFDLAVVGVYGDVVVQYWNGVAWTPVSGLTGAAVDLAASGKLQWTKPTDWAKYGVNGSSYYWLKLTATTPWTTPATINSIRQNCVVNVDYILDAGQAGADGRLPGRIGRLATGMLVDGEETKVSFTYTTWTSTRIPIAGSSFIEGAARLEVHPDSGRGLRFDVVVPKCILKPDGSISLDDTKWLEVPMALEVLDDSENNPDAPFGHLVSYDV